MNGFKIILKKMTSISSMVEDQNQSPENMKNNLESKIDEIPRISIGFFILPKCEDLR